MSISKNCEKWYGTYHLFDKWEVIEAGNLMDKGFTPPLRKGFWMQQKRQCERCGYIEMDYKEYF